MKLIFLFLLPIVLFFSCTSNTEKSPQTALDTGRDFIRASLDGDFKKAEALLVKDTQNVQLFASYKTYYDRLPAEKKQNYKSAIYTINKYEDVNDSTSIINYSNSFMRKPMEIKLLRINKVWGVDFKYTYSGDLPIE